MIASIGTDQLLYINLDNAPLAHRGLDGVLITLNCKGFRSLLFGCKLPLTEIFLIKVMLSMLGVECHHLPLDGP